MRELVVKYLSKGISRRSFVTGLTQAGLTMTAAQSVLSSVSTVSQAQVGKQRRAQLLAGLAGFPVGGRERDQVRRADAPVADDHDAARSFSFRPDVSQARERLLQRSALPPDSAS